MNEVSDFRYCTEIVLKSKTAFKRRYDNAKVALVKWSFCDTLEVLMKRRITSKEIREIESGKVQPSARQLVKLKVHRILVCEGWYEWENYFRENGHRPSEYRTHKWVRDELPRAT